MSKSQQAPRSPCNGSRPGPSATRAQCSTISQLATASVRQLTRQNCPSSNSMQEVGSADRTPVPGRLTTSWPTMSVGQRPFPAISRLVTTCYDTRLLLSTRLKALVARRHTHNVSICKLPALEPRFQAEASAQKHSTSQQTQALSSISTRLSQATRFPDRRLRLLPGR